MRLIDIPSFLWRLAVADIALCGCQSVIAHHNGVFRRSPLNFSLCETRLRGSGLQNFITLRRLDLSYLNILRFIEICCICPLVPDARD